MKKQNRVFAVRIGSLEVGGNNPVRIKGMLKGSPQDEEKLLKEANRLKKEGAEALRLAVKEEKNVRLGKVIKEESGLPIVADVHFHYRIALKCIEQGYDGIRLNPLNIYKKTEVKAVVKEAKLAGISIRVGINSGGFKEDFKNEYTLAKKMVDRVADYIKIIESISFFDTIVSLKASSIEATVLANQLFRERFSYPLHLGITASGPFIEGVVKSAIGIGFLLQQGIGEVIRVSLTAPSFWEIRVAKFILQTLQLRNFAPEIISCPTCSRCEVDLIGLVNKFNKRIGNRKLPFKRIALMGCVVNGPGEAYQSDIGLAFGRKKAVIFKKDKILGWTTPQKAIEDLWEKIKREEESGDKRT